MKNRDLIGCEDAIHHALECVVRRRIDLKTRVARLDALRREHALRCVARIRFAAEFLRCDREIDLRDFELWNVVDESERRDAQLSRTRLEAAGVDVRDAALQQRSVKIVRRRRAHERRNDAKHGECDTSQRSGHSLKGRRHKATARLLNRRSRP